MQTFNNPFGVGERVLKKNMPYGSYKTKMKTKWTGSYTIVQVIHNCRGYCSGGINLRINRTTF